MNDHSKLSVYSEKIRHSPNAWCGQTLHLGRHSTFAKAAAAGSGRPSQRISASCHHSMEEVLDERRTQARLNVNLFSSFTMCDPSNSSGWRLFLQRKRPCFARLRSLTKFSVCQPFSSGSPVRSGQNHHSPKFVRTFILRMRRGEGAPYKWELYVLDKTPMMAAIILQAERYPEHCEIKVQLGIRSTTRRANTH